MQQLLKLPLIFFFIASVVGVLLRWHQVYPVEGFVYPYWLHAHSHLMFLGWVFNTLAVNAVVQFLPDVPVKRYTNIIWLLNALVLGMLISFPLQGYGVYSIIISTLHTVVAVVFIVHFFRATRHAVLPEVQYMKVAFTFFMLSAAGPFALGALMANGLGQTPAYHLAVYYYLHFQYNGVFMFGALALFYRLLRQKEVVIQEMLAQRGKILLIISCLLTYALSALWLQPSVVVYALGLVGALLQMVAFVFIYRSVDPGKANVLQRFSKPARIFFLLAVFALIVKLLLQLVSVVPVVAQLAFEVRFYVIAYLHLVLIGVVSFFLLGWYHEQEYLKKVPRTILYLLILAFVASETAMILVGVIDLDMIRAIILFSSIAMSVAIGVYAIRQKGA
ncbi:MAG: hypothetical protein QY309_02625 [Cyclobacteriaceae bacterium]|nr:MAG: hypothetical protein QY309_02625 [Cyclobacteriaceae bacterium]